MKQVRLDREKLRGLRKVRGWDQAELGIRAGGITAQAISHYESGRRKPRNEIIVRLADALEVHPSELEAGETNIYDDLSTRGSTMSVGRSYRLRIGVAPFWDVGLLRAFTPLLITHGIEPYWVIADWSRDVRDLFRSREIDIALHNMSLVIYDERSPDALGLKMLSPLFVFKGHHVFVSGKRIQEVIDDIQRQDSANESVDLATLKRFARGELRLLDRERNRNEIRYLLKDSSVGVERGTDLEIAVKRGFESVGLEYNASVGTINPVVVGDDGEEEELKSSRQLFEAFQAEKLDIFSSGLPHTYKLLNLRKDSSSGYPRILFHPTELRVASPNGFIIDRDFTKKYPGSLDIMTEVWFQIVSYLRRIGNQFKQNRSDDFARLELSTIARYLNLLVPEARIDVDADETSKDKTSELERWYDMLNEHNIFYEDGKTALEGILGRTSSGRPETTDYCNEIRILAMESGLENGRTME